MLGVGALARSKLVFGLEFRVYAAPGSDRLKAELHTGTRRIGLAPLNFI